MKSQRASYLQLFKDCGGGEHITDFNGFPTLGFILELESDTEFENYVRRQEVSNVVRRFLTMRMLPILLLFSALPVFSKLLSEGVISIEIFLLLS